MSDIIINENWTKTGDIATIIHIYYLDLIEEIAEKTRNLPPNCDYYISVPIGMPELLDPIAQHFPEARILQVENRGRDISPFLEILRHILPLNYKLLVKIHSKKTLHRSDGTSWRQDVYEKLLGSPKLVQTIINAFDDNPKLGILGPQGHVLNAQFYLGGNKEILRYLISRTGFENSEAFEFPFVASTMFWAKPELFKPLIATNIKVTEFPNEPLPDDSTMAHALERFFGFLAVEQGYLTQEIDKEGVLKTPDPFTIYKFTAPSKTLAITQIKSLVYYRAYKEAYATEHLRITAPYQAAGIEIIPGEQDDIADPERVLLGDAVILQREFPRNTALYDKIVSIARQNNKLIIYDIDDLLFDLPETNPHWINGDMIDAFLPMLSAIIEADLVFVPNEILKQTLLDFNPNTLVLPNYLDDRIWQLREPKTSDDDFLTIGFMGSNSHTADLDLISDVIRALLQKHEGKLKFRVIGTPLPESLLGDSNVEWQASPTNVYTDFARYFQKLDFDIFVAPLVQNLFNSCKSNLKFLEYASLGVPGVYSAIAPYQNTISHGVDGFLASSSEVWTQSLEALIQNPDLRLQMARAAQDKIRESWILTKRIRSWQDILQDFDPSAFKESATKATSTHLMNSVRRQIDQHQKVLSQQNANYQHDNLVLNNLVSDLNDQRDALNEHINKLNDQAHRMILELNSIYQDRSWKNYSRYKRVRNKLRSVGGRILRGNNPLSILRGSSTKELELLRNSELFDASYYLSRYPDVKNAGVDPAKHYLIHGGKEGRQPSEVFDGEWYLLTNPDVKNAGMNPLIHYLRFGKLEGRLAWASPADIEQDPVVQASIEKPPAKPIIPKPLFLAPDLLNILQKNLKSSYQLSLSHDDYLSVTGGVQVYIREEQKAALASEKSYLHIYPYHNDTITKTEDEVLYLGVNLDGKAIGETEADEFLLALNRLEDKTLTYLSIHQGMGFTFPFLHKVLELSADEHRFWLHDYYSLCPSYNLMRNDISFCGAPDMDSNACKLCKYLKHRRIQFPEFVKLIEQHQVSIVSPSRFTYEFWQAHFPVQAKQVKVRPPARLEWLENLAPQPEKHTINIGFLGYPIDTKGWQAWLSLTKSMEGDSRYSFFQFSTVAGEPGNYKTIETRVSKENPNAMVNGLKNQQIDVVLLWSTWPETFSFTLHEGLATGAYVLTNPNSGNIQFYLNKHPHKGKVLSDINALLSLFESGEIIDLINDINKKGKANAILHYGNLLEELL